MTSQFTWGYVAGSAQTSASVLLAAAIARQPPKQLLPFWLDGVLGVLFLGVALYAERKRARS